MLDQKIIRLYLGRSLVRTVRMGTHSDENEGENKNKTMSHMPELD
jgi:hypothetical protein